MGASLAGATAAATLRKDGFEGDVVLIGAEPRPPYERPQLSKSYLRGETVMDDLLVRPEGFWADHGVELRTGSRVTSVDTDRRLVQLEGGEDLPFDRLLLATGCRNRALRIPGADLEGVHLLRTVDDCDRLRAEASVGRTAVIGGMSFIGSEVAASLRQMGLDVAAVVSDAYPLQRVFGDAVGRALDAIHREHGVRLVPGDRVEAIEGDGRVDAILTAKGERLACDLAVLAMGVEPAAELTETTPIEVDDGIVVDDRCRTNVEGVFAAGDVASSHHPRLGRRVRVEHWQNARRQGRAAARSMLGKGGPFEEVPWFWSDQYEHELQYAGFHGEWDEVVVREGDGGLAVFYIGGGVLQAAVALDLGLEVRRAMPFIAERAPIRSLPLG